MPYIDAYKYASSDEVFYRSKDDDQVRKLTFQEWLNFGAPAPTLQDTAFLKLPWLDDVFMVYPIGRGYHVTFEDWLYYGQPTPKVVPRFAGDIWTRSADGKDIVYRNDNNRFTKVVTPEEYARAGSPPLS
ncbi:hypothetical protein JT358_03135 [Micrococcales bacterium 31B]|nr:hypothetical protein [Micrococcales bacterium 31B]